MANKEKFKKFELENLIRIKYKILNRHSWFKLDYQTYVIDQMTNENLEENINILRIFKYEENKQRIIDRIDEEEKIWKEKFRKLEELDINQKDYEKDTIYFNISDILDSEISFFFLRKFEGFLERDLELEPNLKEIKQEGIFFIKKKEEIKEIRKKKEEKKDKGMDYKLEKFFKKESLEKKKIENKPLEDVRLINMKFLISILEKLEKLQIKMDWLNAWIKLEKITLNEENDLENLIAKKLELKKAVYDEKFRNIILVMKDINKYEDKILLEKLENFKKWTKLFEGYIKYLGEKKNWKVKKEDFECKNEIKDVKVEEFNIRISLLKKDTIFRLYNEMENGLPDEEDNIFNIKSYWFTYWNPRSRLYDLWLEKYYEIDRSYFEFNYENIVAFRDISETKEFKEWKISKKEEEEFYEKRLKEIEEDKVLVEKKEQEKEGKEKFMINLNEDAEKLKNDILLMSKSMEELYEESVNEKKKIIEKFDKQFKELENITYNFIQNKDLIEDKKKEIKENEKLNFQEKIEWGLSHIYNKFNLKICKQQIDFVIINYDHKEKNTKNFKDLENVSEIKNISLNISNSMNEIKELLKYKEDEKKLEIEKLKIKNTIIKNIEINYFGEKNENKQQDIINLIKEVEYYKQRNKELLDLNEKWKIICKEKNIINKIKEKDDIVNNEKNQDNNSDGKLELKKKERKVENLKKETNKEELLNKNKEIIITKKNIINRLNLIERMNTIVIDNKFIDKTEDLKNLIEDKESIILINGWKTNEKNEKILEKKNKEERIKNIFKKIFNDKTEYEEENNIEWICKRFYNDIAIKKDVLNHIIYRIFWNNLNYWENDKEDVIRINLGIFNKIENADIKIYKTEIEKILSILLKENKKKEDIKYGYKIWNNNDNIIIINDIYNKEYNFIIEINQKIINDNNIIILDNNLAKIINLRFIDFFKKIFIWNNYLISDKWKLYINNREIEGNLLDCNRINEIVDSDVNREIKKIINKDINYKINISSKYNDSIMQSKKYNYNNIYYVNNNENLKKLDKKININKIIIKNILNNDIICKRNWKETWYERKYINKENIYNKINKIFENYEKELGWNNKISRIGEMKDIEKKYIWYNESLKNNNKQIDIIWNKNENDIKNMMSKNIIKLKLLNKVIRKDLGINNLLEIRTMKKINENEIENYINENEINLLGDKDYWNNYFISIKLWIKKIINKARERINEIAQKKWLKNWKKTNKIEIINIWRKDKMKMENIQDVIKWIKNNNLKEKNYENIINNNEDLIKKINEIKLNINEKNIEFWNYIDLDWELKNKIELNFEEELEKYEKEIEEKEKIKELEKNLEGIKIENITKKLEEKINFWINEKNLRENFEEAKLEKLILNIINWLYRWNKIFYWNKIDIKEIKKLFKWINMFIFIKQIMKYKNFIIIMYNNSFKIIWLKNYKNNFKKKSIKSVIYFNWYEISKKKENFVFNMDINSMELNTKDILDINNNTAYDDVELFKIIEMDENIIKITKDYNKNEWKGRMDKKIDNIKKEINEEILKNIKKNIKIEDYKILEFDIKEVINYYFNKNEIEQYIKKKWIFNYKEDEVILLWEKKINNFIVNVNNLIGVINENINDNELINFYDNAENKIYKEILMKEFIKKLKLRKIMRNEFTKPIIKKVGDINNIKEELKKKIIREKKIEINMDEIFIRKEENMDIREILVKEKDNEKKRKKDEKEKENEEESEIMEEQDEIEKEQNWRQGFA